MSRLFSLQAEEILRAVLGRAGEYGCNGLGQGRERGENRLEMAEDGLGFDTPIINNSVSNYLYSAPVVHVGSFCVCWLLLCLFAKIILRHSVPEKYFSGNILAKFATNINRKQKIIPQIIIFLIDSLLAICYYDICCYCGYLAYFAWLIGAFPTYRGP